jgi:hypothetical protein
MRAEFESRRCSRSNFPGNSNHHANEKRFQLCLPPYSPLHPITEVGLKTSNALPTRAYPLLSQRCSHLRATWVVGASSSIDSEISLSELQVQIRRQAAFEEVEMLGAPAPFTTQKESYGPYLQSRRNGRSHNENEQVDNVSDEERDSDCEQNDNDNTGGTPSHVRSKRKASSKVTTSKSRTKSKPAGGTPGQRPGNQSSTGWNKSRAAEELLSEDWEKGGGMLQVEVSKVTEAQVVSLRGESILHQVSAEHRSLIFRWRMDYLHQTLRATV